MRFIRKGGRIIPIRDKRSALDNPVVKYGPIAAMGAAGAFTATKAILIGLKSKTPMTDPHYLKWLGVSGGLGKAKMVVGGAFIARALHNAKKSDKLEAATIEGVKQTVATMAGAAAGLAATYAFRKKLRL